MYPSFWAQFHDFFETALYWFASTFNLTAEFAKIRGALQAQRAILIKKSNRTLINF